MARLRAFQANGGVIYDLLLKKKKAVQKKARRLQVDREISEKKKAAGMNETRDNLTILNIGKRTVTSRYLRSIRSY